MNKKLEDLIKKGTTEIYSEPCVGIFSYYIAETLKLRDALDPNDVNNVYSDALKELRAAFKNGISNAVREAQGLDKNIKHGFKDELKNEPLDDLSSKRILH